MKKGKASRTAEGAALARAMESRRREDERVFYDPLAEHFLGTAFLIVARSRLLTKIANWYFERAVPGVPSGTLVRIRYIDDYLKACIDDGIAQLVILGAGYDSRAYRLDELKERVRVFEVDYPATQKLKTEKVKEIFGSLPDHVVYVSIDFDRGKLNEALFQSGYEKSFKTLFIWEGVTMYLTAEAVDKTLAFVAGNSGQGSSIIFDYIFQSFVDGTCELEEAERLRKYFRRKGEPPTFGIDEEAIEEFLATRGFYQVKNVTLVSLKSAYFEQAGRDPMVSPVWAVVHAKVKPHGST